MTDSKRSCPCVASYRYPAQAKWSAWHQLGDLSKLEAMARALRRPHPPSPDAVVSPQRLYVKTLEQDNPSWWSLSTRGFDPERVAAATAEAGAAASGLLSHPPLPPATLPPGAHGPLLLPPPLKSLGGGGNVSSHLLQLGSLTPGAGWVTGLRVGGKPPSPRYFAACVATPTHVVLHGGSAHGRTRADAHVLSLATLEWAPLHASDPPLPPLAGHVALLHAPKASSSEQQNGSAPVVLLVGGFAKGAPPGAPLRIIRLDPVSGKWAVVETSGQAPCARGGHCAALVPGRDAASSSSSSSSSSSASLSDSLWVFGGEDRLRRSLGDAVRLDLRTLAWDPPLGAAPPPAPAVASGSSSNGAAASASALHPPPPPASSAASSAAAAASIGTPPAPRSAALAAHLGHGLVAVGFGMLSSGECTNSIAVLDTRSGIWITPSINLAGGMSLAPRAAAAGCVAPCGAWYVAGGGDGKGPRHETLALRLSRRGGGENGGVQQISLSVRVVATAPKGSPVACEGMCLVPIPSPQPLHTPSSEAAPSHPPPASSSSSAASAAAAPPSQHSHLQPPHVAPLAPQTLLLAWGGYDGSYHGGLSAFAPPGEPFGDALMSAASEHTQERAVAAAEAAAAAAAGIAPPSSSSAAAAPAVSAAASANEAAASPAAHAEALPPQPPQRPPTPPVPPAPAPAAAAAAAAAASAAAEIASLRAELAAARAAAAAADSAAAASAAAADAEGLRALRAEAEAAQLRTALDAAKEREEEREAAAWRAASRQQQQQATAAAAAAAAPEQGRGGGLFRLLTGV